MRFHAIKKSAWRDVEDFTKSPEAARANAVRAAFVFLDLLECDANLIGEICLTKSCGFPQYFQLGSHKCVNFRCRPYISLHVSPYPHRLFDQCLDEVF